MSERNDGGPAFPRDAHGPFEWNTQTGISRIGASTGAPGMSLRDWFAGQAMAAMTMPDDGQYSKADHVEGYPTKQAGWRAAAAYRYADAMLGERSKP